MGVFKRIIKGKDGNKSDHWYIDYAVDGKRKWEAVGKVGEVSKEDAKKLLAFRKTEILQGKFNASKPKIIPTFSEFAKEYLEFARGNKKSWERDMYALRSLMPFLGSYKLTEISPILIEKYKLERKQAVSTRTVNIELALLRRMFNLATSWDKCKSNPLNKVKSFQGLPPKERVLTEEEEKRLIDESPKHLRPILITALNTGMRRGEILLLKWSEIDLSTGYIHVRKSKSGKSRKIPINETLRETLLELQSQNFVSNSVSSDSTLVEKSNKHIAVTSVTHWIQDPVGESSWGFKSPLRHHRYQPIFPF
jgi:integrase